MTLRQFSSRAAIRALLGLVSVGLLAIGFVSEGPAAAVGLVIGSVTAVGVVLMAARSGWMLLV